MSSRKKISDPYGSEMRGYASINSGHFRIKVFDALINYGFEETCNPIIINGARHFSVYTFKKEREYPFIVLMCNEYGIKTIVNLCYSFNNLNLIKISLERFFKNRVPENLFKKMEYIIPALSKFIYDHKDNQIINPDKMNMKQLCIYYPLTPGELRTVNSLHNKIITETKERVWKTQFYLN